ncbi:S24 family peptidase [Xanthobacter autotrophicus]|uniref:S24 family peptidase n=1 Tax=Xanthobacter autotrophicus TaxID=280 RepID=UPI00372721B7
MIIGKFPNGLADAMARIEIGPTELARRVGTAKQNIDRWAKQTRKLPPEMAQELARHIGWTAAQLLLLEPPPPPDDMDSMDVAAALDNPERRNPNAAIVVGSAGAGAEVYPIDDHEKGAGLDEIEAPFPVPPSTVCVVIRGDSMLPVFQDGDLVGYSKEPRPPGDLIGVRCLVKLRDGRMFIKVLKRGTRPGLFTLVSFNAGDIEDVDVEWAAQYDFTLARGRWHYSKSV